jgi:hypothetical protein
VKDRAIIVCIQVNSLYFSSKEQNAVIIIGNAKDLLNAALEDQLSWLDEQYGFVNLHSGH